MTNPPAAATVQAMRARLIALSALVCVLGTTVIALKTADSNLEKQFTATAPQLEYSAGGWGGGGEAGESTSAVGAAEETADAQFDPVQPASDVVTWEAENNYLMRENLLRLGWGPALKNQIPAQQQSSSEDGIEVLAVGDSFVWGEAVEDLDMRWPQVLERTLNTQGSQDRYHVTSLGRLPASLMQMADWINPERLAEINPDIVVLGYLNNDIIPTFEETNLCNQYGTCTQEGETPVAWNRKNGPLVACLKGQDSALGFLLRTTINPYFPYVGRWLTNRYCDPDRIAAGDVELQEGKWIDNPSESPYWSSVEESIERLGRNLNGTPTIVFDYWGVFDHIPGQARVKTLLEANGLTVLRPDQTMSLLETKDQALLGINPGDRHPGPLLTHAYATDISAAVLELLGKDASGTTGTPTPRAAQPGGERVAVSNYLPAALELTTDATSFHARGRPLSAQAQQEYRDLVNRGGSQEITWETACARMGRPHARIMLNPYLDNYTLTLTADPGTPPLVVMPVGYDNDGAAVEGKPQLLSETNTLTIDMGANYRGILIGTTKAGCEPGQVKLPVMSIRGTLEPN